MIEALITSMTTVAFETPVCPAAWPPGSCASRLRRHCLVSIGSRGPGLVRHPPNLAANQVLRTRQCASITQVPEKLTLINPPGLHPTAGYAHVTIAEAGRTAHLAGLCPLDENEAVVGLGRLEAQIDQVIANGLRILTAVGARPHDVVRSVIYVVSDESRTLGAAWAQLTASELAPALATASTLLGVTCLGYSGQLVEIDLTVAL